MNAMMIVLCMVTVQLVNFFSLTTSILALACPLARSWIQVTSTINDVLYSWEVILQRIYYIGHCGSYRPENNYHVVQ